MGVFDRKPFYSQAAETFGQPFSQAEVQLADGAWVVGGDFGKRAMPEHEADPRAALGATRAEAAPCNLCLNQVGRVMGTGQFGSASVAFLPASLVRVLLAPDGCREDTC